MSSIYKTENLSEDAKRLVYDRYIRTYELVGNLWFKNKEELFKPYSHIMMFNSGGCYFLYREFAHRKKISVIIHDGTREEKHLLMEEIAKLLKTKEWIFECTGRPYVILTERYKLEPIRDIESIKYMLSSKENGYRIVENYTDDVSYTYTRVLVENNKIYENRENLFGQI